MKLKGIIVDADFCIKVGASPKYRYLERVLTGLADKVYIHKIVYDEIMIPACAKEQIDFLRRKGIIEILDENILNPIEQVVYQGVYQSLAKVMINPKRPRKNQGEICSLAIAKTKSIPYFATDEMDLQPIVNRILNTGMDDIFCIRIEDVIRKIKSGELEGFKRKEAKVLWRLAGKSTNLFDKCIWPAE
ncbi:MAG TPA: hypothetical protein H9809_11200 [Candidatus Blautia pullicola]|uniref:PIN domain-containing protein n=1 Tax=Candidatus Blautia pullicola TaxID=2838498 RepID=A0A9D2JTX4_9FIRM|nr:hypothetical protein [Candidatus Blautia pullicola]